MDGETPVWQERKRFDVGFLYLQDTARKARTGESLDLSMRESDVRFEPVVDRQRLAVGRKGQRLDAVSQPLERGDRLPGIRVPDVSFPTFSPSLVLAL
jgi:hypothetical protein